MLRMSVRQRPWTEFDPANQDHRAYFGTFLKTQSWKDCPVQWIIGDDSRDIVHYISKQLLNYYDTQEFGSKRSKTVAKKPRIASKNG